MSVNASYGLKKAISDANKRSQEAFQPHIDRQRLCNAYFKANNTDLQGVFSHISTKTRVE